jgi:hypothetical protein
MSILVLKKDIFFLDLLKYMRSWLQIISKRSSTKQSLIDWTEVFIHLYILDSSWDWLNY